LADKIFITYFMEDVAQEAFIKSLVTRIAAQEGITGNRLLFDRRTASGGYVSIAKFRAFVRDYSEQLWALNRILVVVRDTNCMRHNERLKELKAPLKDHGLGSDDRIAFALPDPHIERWYVTDQKAFNDVVGQNAAPPMPRQKCGKNYWKNILHKALQAAGIESRIGGSEYGGPIAATVNISQLEKADSSFKKFADDLRRAFKVVQSTGSL